MGFNLILPYFVLAGRNIKEPIRSMPGLYRFSADRLIEDVREARALGIKSILLFGISKVKDQYAAAAYSQRGAVQEAVRLVKKNVSGMSVITDVCLCGYTSHGHCGILKISNIKYQKSNIRSLPVERDKDKTIKALVEAALSHARAGADVVAPSAMMPGQVKAIRGALDKSGLRKVRILAYSAKYASNFYGPFREALGSAPRFGDRRGYQLGFKDPEPALRRIGQDIKEGADMVMVKPALAYLDIIYRAKQRFSVPLAAYSVSGEYSLLKQGAKVDAFREREAALEVLAAIKRAGADLIITYYAKEIARWLKD